MPCPARLKSEVVEMKKSKAILSLICAILCVCTVLCSCSGGGNNATTSAGTTAPAAETTAEYTVSNGVHSKIGNGKFSFVLEVIDGNGGSTVFDVAINPPSAMRSARSVLYPANRAITASMSRRSTASPPTMTRTAHTGRSASTASCRKRASIRLMLKTAISTPSR